jgi:hypothetical protein
MTQQNQTTPDPVLDPRLLLLSDKDNILVVLGAIQPGEFLMIEGQRVRVKRLIELGHKMARTNIKPGDKVIKYGASIGSATMEIECGDHVHLKNMKSDYTPTYALNGVAS